eukprot:13324652-Alexandrium_andersonii.AAC.1
MVSSRGAEGVLPALREGQWRGSGLARIAAARVGGSHGRWSRSSLLLVQGARPRERRGSGFVGCGVARAESQRRRHLLGDANVRNIEWLRFSSRNSPEGRALQQWCAPL